MKLQLVDLNTEMCEAWEEYFDGCADVTVHNKSFFDLPTDCVVSPANSFGFMDGGLDAVITKRFGRQLQEGLQARIASNGMGELLVGQAEMLETGNKDIPYCISAPTMRVSLDVSNTVNVYLAAKAVFNIVKRVYNNEDFTVTMSGLGTGVGRVSPDTCAKQMKLAYDEVWLNKFVFPTTFGAARFRHTHTL